MTSQRVQGFYESQAPIYDATRRWLLPGRRRAHQLLDVRPGQRVIDFACGTGLNFPALVAARAAEIIGVDLSPAMLARAHRRCPRARLVQGDLTQLDLGATADRAICTYGLSLMEDPRRAIERMCAHLRTDAMLVILDFHELDDRVAFARPLWRAWLRRFHVRDDVLSLVPALRALFQRVDVETHTFGACAILRASNPRPSPHFQGEVPGHASGTIS
jgi:ubiquinone/menaquinone biosynthesis C-methylase UbiE